MTTQHMQRYAIPYSYNKMQLWYHTPPCSRSTPSIHRRSITRISISMLALLLSFSLLPSPLLFRFSPLLSPISLLRTLILIHTHLFPCARPIPQPQPLLEAHPIHPALQKPHPPVLDRLLKRIDAHLAAALSLAVSAVHALQPR